MTLDSTLRPFIEKLAEAGQNHDEDGFINSYTPNATIVDITDKEIHAGHDALRTLFRKYCTFGKWTSTASNEEFSGCEDIIRYTCLSTLSIVNGPTMSFNVLQYWRKVADGSYKCEVEQFTNT
ncbi:unnamed protein product, partial [Mesorhabditis spiculigera]